MSPLLQLISNELDITFHAQASQLPNPIMRCRINFDVIPSNKRCVKIAVLVIIYEHIVLCKKKTLCMYCRADLIIRSLDCYFGV